MIDVWFIIGDLGASVRFNANRWGISSLGRLNLIKDAEDCSESVVIATFDVGVWQYVCAVSAEVIKEEKDES